MCNFAITPSGAATAAAATSTATADVNYLASESGSSSHHRWETAKLITQLQAATAHIQLLQSKLGAAEAKLAMHRAAAVAAKQRIDDLEGMMMQLQQQHNSKLLNTLLGAQQSEDSGAVGVPHTPDYCGGSSCCCGSSALRSAPADGCGNLTDAAALAAEAGDRQQQHPGWDIVLSPSIAPAVLQQQQLQLGRLTDQLRMAICDNTVLCYECMHLQHLLVQERFVGRSACQVSSLLLQVFAAAEGGSCIVHCSVAARVVLHRQKI
jgi:hypothetical protein